MDIQCAHCAEPWDVWGLRNDGWGYLDSGTPDGVPSSIAADVEVAGDHTLNESVTNAAARRVNAWLYKAVLRGQGCPHCGFDHTGEGPHREAQLRALVIDGVTDDDPMEFML